MDGALAILVGAHNNSSNLLVLFAQVQEKGNEEENSHSIAHIEWYVQILHMCFLRPFSPQNTPILI